MADLRLESAPLHSIDIFGLQPITNSTWRNHWNPNTGGWGGVEDDVDSRYPFPSWWNWVKVLLRGVGWRFVEEPLSILGGIGSECRWVGWRVAEVASFHPWWNRVRAERPYTKKMEPKLPKLLTPAYKPVRPISIHHFSQHGPRSSLLVFLPPSVFLH